MSNFSARLGTVGRLKENMIWQDLTIAYWYRLSETTS